MIDSETDKTLPSHLTPEAKEDRSAGGWGWGEGIHLTRQESNVTTTLPSGSTCLVLGV